MSQRNNTANNCPNCNKTLLDGAPACPFCGEKMSVEHPGDIKRVRHKPLDLPPPSPSTYQRKPGEE